MKKGVLPNRIPAKALFLLFGFLLQLSSAFAQVQGQADPGFNTADVGFNTGLGASNLVYTTSLSASGKILIGGSFVTYNGTALNRVALLNANGTTDTNFNPGTGANGIVSASAFQADGRMLIGGNFTLVNGIARARIARLNTDGTLDTSFDPALGAEAQISAIVVQPNGKILIGGKFVSYNGAPANFLTRLNADGSPDASFVTGTGFDKPVSAIALQPDGKILAGGDFTAYNGALYNRIIRLLPNGAADPAFATGTGAAGSVRTIARQADGKVVIGGTFKKFNAITRNRIARLNADGSLDLTFAATASSNVLAALIQPNNAIVIAGEFVSVNAVSRNRVARLNPDGTLDTSFEPGTGYNSSVYALAAQPNGALLAAGKFTTYNGTLQFRISRVNPTGTKDLSFNPGSGANGAINSFAFQSDGKIIIGGSFTGFNGIPRNRIARLNSDGTVDLTFAPGVGPDNSVLATALQADGKIIIAGSFKKVNGVVKNRIARLNPDGTPDATFLTGTGAGNIIYALQLQADGKILAGGKFVTFNGLPARFIARLNTNGSIDATFTSGTGFNKTVHALAVQTDGKIIAGGEFTTLNGTAINRLARLNTDGTKDGTFTTGAGAAGTVKAIAVQSDGKILIGGAFVKFNAIVRNRIARLTTDGTLDTSFDPGTGANAIVNTLALQTDGKIFAAGDFTTFNSLTVNRLIRLTSTGTEDLAFNTGTGANAAILALALQNNGHILIGGNFTSYAGTGRNRAARVFGQLITPPGISTSNLTSAGICPGGTVNVPFTVTGAFAPGNIFTALLSDVTGSFAVPVSIGGLAGTSAGTISATLPMGIPAGTGYRIKVVGSAPAIAGGSNANNLTVISSPSVLAIASPASICLGASASLSATGAIAYSWSTGQSGAGIVVSPTADATYTVTGTSGQGCAAQSTVQVIVTPPPALTVTAAAATICAGQSTTLSVTGGTSYTWQATPGLSGSGSVVTVTPASAGIQTYTVTGSNGSCAPVQAIGQVEVLTPQSAAFTYPANAFCTSAANPTPVTVSAGVFSATPTGLVFADPVTGTIDLASSTAGTYSVVFTTSGPCAATASSATITLTGAPAVNLAPNFAVCAGTAVTVQANGTAAANYAWTGPNNFSATGPTLTLASPATAMSGTYTVTASLNGCSQTAITNLAVSAAPATGFTFTQGNCTGCINFFNSTPAPNTYSYNFGDGSAPGTHPNPVHQYLTSGTFTVTQTVTNPGGCTATSTQVVSVLLAAEETLADLTKIYPNPTTGKLLIELPGIMANLEVNAEVYTLTGQLQKTYRLSASSVNEINLLGLTPGAYLLRIETPGGVIIKQVLVQ